MGKLKGHELLKKSYVAQLKRKLTNGKKGKMKLARKQLETDIREFNDLIQDFEKLKSKVSSDELASELLKAYHKYSQEGKGLEKHGFSKKSSKYRAETEGTWVEGKVIKKGGKKDYNAFLNKFHNTVNGEWRRILRETKPDLNKMINTLFKSKSQQKKGEMLRGLLNFWKRR